MRGFSFLSFGSVAILAACILNTVVAAGFSYATRIEPSLSPLSGIFIRVLAGASCVFLPMVWGAEPARLHTWREDLALWLWGLFGVLTVGSYFFAVTMVGAGTATLLNAGSGVFIVALAPLFLRRSSTRQQWLGVLGSVVGLSLLVSARPIELHSGLGLLLGTLSGLFGGIAYLFVARSGARHSPEKIALHWTITNVAVFGIILALVPAQWPQSVRVWILIVAAGLLAAWAKYLTAIAYQRSPAAHIACLSYLGPALSVLLDLWLFHIHFPQTAVAGIILILVFGIFIPLRSGSWTKC